MPRVAKKSAPKAADAAPTKKEPRLRKDGKRYRKAKKPTLASAIRNVQGQVHPGQHFQTKSMQILLSLASDIGDRFIKECDNVRRMNGKKVIDSRTVQTAAKLILSGELSKHAISEMQKANANYAAWKPEQ